MIKAPAIYMLSNKRRGTLYVGVTSNLPGRIWQHKQRLDCGFTARYNLTTLVFFEVADDIYAAISREKQIKAGSRRRKIQLIEHLNPEWTDLYPYICQ